MKAVLAYRLPAMMGKCWMSVLPNMVATSHMGLLSIGENSWSNDMSLLFALSYSNRKCGWWPPCQAAQL